MKIKIFFFLTNAVGITFIISLRPCDEIKQKNQNVYIANLLSNVMYILLPVYAQWKHRTINTQCN